jgi:hypothetical protein
VRTKGAQEEEADYQSVPETEGRTILPCFSFCEHESRIGHLPVVTMNPEQNRYERFIEYTAFLRERFNAGVLSELQREPRWVVWRAELE